MLMCFALKIPSKHLVTCETYEFSNNSANLKIRKCHNKLSLQVLLTVLTQLEIGDEQYLHLLPQFSVTCTLYFHKVRAYPVIWALHHLNQKLSYRAQLVSWGPCYVSSNRNSPLIVFDLGIWVLCTYHVHCFFLIRYFTFLPFFSLLLICWFILLQTSPQLLADKDILLRSILKK
jgi:hypothetical protein